MNIQKELQVKIGELLNKDYSSHTAYQAQNSINPFVGGTDTKMIPINTEEQEPSLNDVLMAIHKCIEKDTISHSDGYEKIVDICYRNGFYDLSKSLFQQSPETLQAIYNLLK